jgi:membrane fusion protein, heavy metal efflux system
MKHRISYMGKFTGRLTGGVVCLVAAWGMSGCGQKAELAAHVDPLAAAPVSDSGKVVLPANSPKLQQIRVDAAGMQNFAVDEVVAPAKIELNPNRVSKLMLPVAGRIVSALVHIGDSVTAGQPLLIIESSDADSALASDIQAEATYAQAASVYAKAKADYERLADLLAQDAVAKKDVLAAEAGVAQAKASVDQADGMRRQTKARLDLLGLKAGQPRQRVEVKAPIAGRILEMSTVAGEFRNDTSTPVLTIADLSSVWVGSDIPENQIRFIKAGERLQVELTAYPEETFQATVTRIGDSVDPTTRTIKVYAELKNDRGKLKPEMFGRTRHVSQTKHLVVVPAGAIVEGAGQSYVYRETSPGTFEQTPVVVAGREKDSVGILSGLEPGARIVVDGAMLLKAI